MPKYVPPTGTSKIKPEQTLRQDTQKLWAEEKARVRPNYVRGNLKTEYAKPENVQKRRERSASPKKKSSARR